MQVRIALHRLRQLRIHTRVVVPLAVIPLRLRFQRFIRHIALKFQLLAQIRVHPGRRDASHHIHEGIDLRIILRNIRVTPRHPRVIRAEHQTAIAQQMLAEETRADEHLMVIDQLFRQPGQARELFHHHRALRLRQFARHVQRVRVIAVNKLPRLRHRLLARRVLQIRRKLLVIMRHRRQRGQQHLIRQIVDRRADQRVVIQQTGHDDQAVDVNAVARGQMLRQTAATNAAVAFTRDELRRGPALLTRDPQTDELRHRRDVLPHAEELAHLPWIRRRAESRVHRVDEYQIRVAQQREFIRHQPARRFWRRQAVCGQIHALRTKRTEV